jgi:hypothetical protein
MQYWPTREKASMPPGIDVGRGIALGGSGEAVGVAVLDYRVCPGSPLGKTRGEKKL